MVSLLIAISLLQKTFNGGSVRLTIMSSSKPYDHRARDLTNADIIFTEKAETKMTF